ncbi:GDSL-type esterase/lipase family protein [Coleofasciculus sp. FACHB-129]|uniref:GDSL-type esterase/lipase family protein n=1 Tax=Cyanophyceae TaxID=3028117 RepID=UPI00168670B1|nr:GDSL-type esterase/lipase family protein [Coleofasciculus sp. FACHB-129]MBD1896651.1 acylhydrolase [Coleofasciculus sp. FACHB-129]
MGDPYLLAVSLLTGGQISVPPPPVLPPNEPDTLLALWNSSESSAFGSLVAQKIVPTIESTSPEFSQQLISQTNPFQGTDTLITTALAPTAAQAATELKPSLQAKLKPDTATTKPASGSQLFYQRLAALKAGKIYTRLPADSFQSYWANQAGTKALALQKPSYEQWKRLLAKEARAVSEGQGANRLSVLVGDSLSLWFPQERLPGGSLWLNQGISGDNSRGILKRLSAFSQTRPDAIYVLAGINDLRQGATDETILGNLRQIVRRLRQEHPRSSIIVQSILPTRINTIPNRRIRNLNQQLAILAQQQGAGYLDIHSRFSDVEGNLRVDLTTDGLHLSGRGYEVWQSALQQAESVIALNRNNVRADNSLKRSRLSDVSGLN